MRAPPFSQTRIRGGDRRGCGLVDRSERGKLALTGADAKSFLQGQVSNDVEALTPGTGCYAAFLTPKGKMLGDLRILDTGDELLLDTERVALQELFNMIRRFSIGYDVELHKRTLERGLLSLLGPRPTRSRRRRARRGRALARRGRDRRDPGARDPHRCRGRPAVRRGRHRALTPRCSAPAPCGRRGGRRLRADRARPPALRRRPRRHRDPPGGGPQRARGLVHEGLLRRPGDGRAAVLPRQAQPPPARAAAVGAGRDRRRDQRSAGAPSVGWRASPQSPALGPLALALVRREAPPGSAVTVGADEIRALVVELPFAR